MADRKTGRFENDMTGQVNPADDGYLRQYDYLSKQIAGLTEKIKILEEKRNALQKDIRDNTEVRKIVEKKLADVFLDGVFKLYCDIQKDKAEEMLLKRKEYEYEKDFDKLRDKISHLSIEIQKD